LALPNRPDNVALVREVLAGLADTVEFGDALDDVKAAVSEAANNVVIHAYEGAEGPLEVDIRLFPGELEVIVRDQGVGTAARADDDDHPAGGIGLAVIDALTVHAETRAVAGLGTEVSMRFAIPDSGERVTLAPTDATPTSTERLSYGSDVEIAIAPAMLSAVILNRLVGALAARAGFSIDRLSDAQLITDAIGARIGAVLDGACVTVGIDMLESAIALRVGRLRDGGAASLLAASAIGGLGPVIERLADEIDISRAEPGEGLKLVLRDARATQLSTA
jgi:serine/threonine-protein kinase RsbW